MGGKITVQNFLDSSDKNKDHLIREKVDQRVTLQTISSSSWLIIYRAYNNLPKNAA